MPNIWRLNIKTDAQEGINPHGFCIEGNIMGVGWPVETDEQDLDWESYCELGEEEYYRNNDRGWWPAVNALHNRMNILDLCWTRNSDGIYYLGRITGDWEYENTHENREADVVNVRDCEWYEVGLVDSVPGKVVNSFIQPRTAQQVNGDSVNLYSRYLYNQLCTEPLYDLAGEHGDVDLFTLISAEDCEDVVGIYLQEEGYRLIPSSCKSSTSRYEFVLKNRETGRRAVVQVKQGQIDLNREEYGDAFEGDDVFLFTTHGNYVGAERANAHCLGPGEMRDFVLANRGVLSERLNRWIDFLRGNVKETSLRQ